jgi:hypothetical protein
VAKNIKSIEIKHEAKFQDYSKIFFGLWFFPIGVWFIQPRIRNIVNGITPPPAASQRKTIFSKTEVCPHCSKEINLSSILYSKNPISDIVDPTSFRKTEKMLETYDQIICPHCHHKYKSNKAKFFGFITPKYMKLFLLLYPMAFILFAVIMLIKDLGI